MTTKEVCAAKFSKIWEWIFHYRQQDQPFNTNLKGTTDEKLRVVVRNLLGPVFAFLSDANVLKRLQKPFVTCIFFQIVVINLALKLNLNFIKAL